MHNSLHTQERSVIDKTYRTLINVIPEDLDQVPYMIEKLQKVCDNFNCNKRTGSREHVDCFMLFDIALVSYDGIWMIESFRSSEKRLKWLFKKENNIEC